jgi:two-component system sensor histidine kinase HydH
MTVKNWFSIGTLRFRLTIAFLLVSVPPMLITALLAAQLLGQAFDKNLNQWLTETLTFFNAEVEEVQYETQKAANIIARRIIAASEPLPDKEIASDVALLTALGTDFVAIHDSESWRYYGAQGISDIGPLPSRSTGSIFIVKTNGRSMLAIGAVHIVNIKGRTITIIVGNWLNDTFSVIGKVVQALKFEVFVYQDKTLSLTPIGDEQWPSSVKQALTIQPNGVRLDDILASHGKPLIYDPGDQSPLYLAAYVPLRAATGELVGVVAAGVNPEQDLFERVNKLNMFTGIFLGGFILSVLAGVAISGLLAKPLQKLTSAVRSIGHGDFHQRIPEKGGSELEELARSFNSMATELERFKAIEADLRRREKFSAVGEAAAVIAHEIRNPLGIIKTSTDLVRSRSHLAPSEATMMDYISDEVKRIDRLIHDFLDFARAAPPHLHSLDLRDVVARAKAIMQPEFDRLQTTCLIAIKDDPPKVSADPDHIYQALLNLLLNALDAMAANKPDRPRILTIELVREQDLVRLSVLDQGPGMEDATRKRAFDPFYTTKAKGSGLGLAKVQSIMEAHGGTVHYREVAGYGACFDLIFPIPRS